MSLPEITLAESTEGRILQAVKDRLTALTLPGIASDRILIQEIAWQPDESVTPPPYVIIAPPPESTPWQDGTNETDTTMFAAVVVIVLANARDVTTRNMGLQLYWRERIRRKFQNLSKMRFSELTLEDGTFYIHGTIESGDRFLEAAKRDQRDAQYFLLRFKVKEPRE